MHDLDIPHNTSSNDKKTMIISTDKGNRRRLESHGGGFDTLIKPQIQLCQQNIAYTNGSGLFDSV